MLYRCNIDHETMVYRCIWMRENIVHIWDTHPSTELEIKNRHCCWEFEFKTEDLGKLTSRNEDPTINNRTLIQVS